MNVSKEMAVFFMEQCIGETNGHMAAMPNNPTIQGLCRAHGAMSVSLSEEKELFAEFCKQVSEQLSPIDKG